MNLAVQRQQMFERNIFLPGSQTICDTIVRV